MQNISAYDNITIISLNVQMNSNVSVVISFMVFIYAAIGFMKRW